jgi:predicted dehydrogenase
MDAVYIASPPAAHLAHTSTCAEHGLHVFCEKPMAHTVADAEAIVAVCRESGVRLGTAFMLPYHSLAQEAMAIVRRGVLGTVVSARTQFSFDYPPVPGAFRQVAAEGGGGAFMDVGNHAADLMERIVGSRATAAQALAGDLVHVYDGVEDICAALLQFESRAIGTVEASFCNPCAVNRVEVNGSEATLVIDGMMGQGSGGTLRVLGTEETVAQSDGRNMYLGEVTAFAEAVLRGDDPPISGRDGLHSQRLVAAVYESAGTDMRVEIPTG